MEHDWFENDPPEAAAFATSEPYHYPSWWEEVFAAALKTRNPRELHRCFKRWKNEIDFRRKDPGYYMYGRYDDETPPLHYALLALDNNNTASTGSSSSMTSTADLDVEGKGLLDFVAPVARAWGIGVFLGKIRATWHGVKQHSPNRVSLFDRECARAIPNYYFDEKDKGAGEPPGILPNAFRDLSDFMDCGGGGSDFGMTDMCQGIVEMYDLDGNVLLPRDKDMVDVTQNIANSEKFWTRRESGKNIQYDFFKSLEPDHERVFKHEGFRNVYVEQSWFRQVIILVPPTAMWPMCDEAAKVKTWVRVHADDRFNTCIRHLFARHLISQYLQQQQTGNPPIRPRDVVLSNARKAVDNVIGDQRMDGELRGMILQFALQNNDPALFKKACSVLHDGAPKDRKPTPPLPTFFTWLREYFTREDAIKFTSIHQDLTIIVRAYTNLNDRLQAVDNLTKHEPPYSEQTSYQRQWAQGVLLPYVNQTMPDILPLLKTAADGRAVIEIAQFYAPGPQFFPDFVQAYIPKLHVNAEPASASGGPAQLNNGKEPMWLWVIGFLNRLLEKGRVLEQQQQQPGLINGSYRSIFSRVFMRPLNSSSSEAPIDIWRTLNKLNPDPWDPWVQGVSPSEIVQLISDLADLGFASELQIFCVGIVKRARDRSKSSREKDEWKLLDRRDFPGYRTPPDGLREFDNLWIPFLSELVTCTTMKNNNSVTGSSSYRAICRLLFTNILTYYAVVRVGKQPPLEADDLYRPPWGVPPEPWSDQYIELHNFLLDPTRKEARFANYDNKLRARARSSVQYANFHTYCDMKTKPSTFVMVKLSNSDTEHHEAWAERKAKYLEVIGEKFDLDFLRSLLGEEKYNTIMGMSYLDWVKPPPKPQPVPAEIDTGSSPAQVVEEEEESSRKRAASQAGIQEQGPKRVRLSRCSIGTWAPYTE